ncbi:hypothetical protein WA158_005755 [Blastocystis sp. Blastoise]
MSLDDENILRFPQNRKISDQMSKEAGKIEMKSSKSIRKESKKYQESHKINISSFFEAIRETFHDIRQSKGLFIMSILCIGICVGCILIMNTVIQFIPLLFLKKAEREIGLTDIWLYSSNPIDIYTNDSFIFPRISGINALQNSKIYPQLSLYGYIYKQEQCSVSPISSNYCDDSVPKCERYTCSGGNTINIYAYPSIYQFPTINRNNRGNNESPDLSIYIDRSLSEHSLLAYTFLPNKCKYTNTGICSDSISSEDLEKWKQEVKNNPYIYISIEIAKVIDPEEMYSPSISTNSIYISTDTLLTMIQYYLPLSLYSSPSFSSSLEHYPSFYNGINAHNYIFHYSNNIGISLGIEERIYIYTASDADSMKARGVSICNELIYSSGISEVECSLPIIDKLSGISISSVYMSLITDFLFLLLLYIAIIYIYSNITLNYLRSKESITVQGLIGANEHRVRKTHTNESPNQIVHYTIKSSNSSSLYTYLFPILFTIIPAVIYIGLPYALITMNMTAFLYIFLLLLLVIIIGLLLLFLPFIPYISILITKLLFLPRYIYTYIKNNTITRKQEYSIITVIFISTVSILIFLNVVGNMQMNMLIYNSYSDVGSDIMIEKASRSPSGMWTARDVEQIESEFKESSFGNKINSIGWRSSSTPIYMYNPSLMIKQNGYMYTHSLNYLNTLFSEFVKEGSYFPAVIPQNVLSTLETQSTSYLAGIFPSSIVHFLHTPPSPTPYIYSSSSSKGYQYIYPYATFDRLPLYHFFSLPPGTSGEQIDVLISQHDYSSLLNITISAIPVAGIHISTKNVNNCGEMRIIADQMRYILSNCSIYVACDKKEEISTYTNLLNLGFILISILTILICISSLYTTIYMSLYNNKRELYILRALGVQSSIIYIIYCLQYICILLASCTVGLLIGLLLAYTIGLQEEIFMNIPSIFSVSSILIGLIYVVVILGTCLCVYISVRSIMNKPIVQGLKLSE